MNRPSAYFVLPRPIGDRSLWSLLLCLVPLWAQGQADGSVQVSDPVVPYVVEVNLGDLPTVPDWQPGDPIREVPRWQDPTRRPPVPAEESVDPLAARQTAASFLRDPSFSEPLLNFDGQNFSGRTPPDPIGAVGLNYYLQAVNSSTTSVMVYDKSSGNRVAGPIALSNFSVCSGGGDPTVLFDPLNQRWILAEFGTANSLCVLISQSADPIGDPTQTWYAYNFQTPNKPDYFKIGIWNDAFYVTSNELGGSPVYVLEREAMLQGQPARMLRLEAPDLAGFPFQLLMPAGVDGSNPPPPGSPGILMRHKDAQAHGGTTDQLELFFCYTDFDQPNNTFLVGPVAVPISPFSSDLCGFESLNCFPQPSAHVFLDPLREPLMHRLVYRNFTTHEAVLGNFTVDVDGTDRGGIRWFELRRGGNEPWTLYQEGTYTAEDRTNRWVGSAAFDGSGNIALGANVVGPTTYPGLRYIGRLADDPTGTLQRGEHTLIEGTAAANNNRFGDYSAMTIDPVDDCTFWFTGQYNREGRWSTRIGALRFASCGCASPSPTNVLAQPGSEDNEILVSWDPVPNSQGYDLYRTIGACGTSGYRLIAENHQDPQFLDQTASSRVQYAYTVVSRDATLLCPSPPSACASAETTGRCLVPPELEVPPSAVTPGRFTCRVDLSWEAAFTFCTTPIRYSVHRGLTPDFDVTEENAIATCLEATTFSDETFYLDQTYYYKVMAEDAESTGDGGCNGGNVGNQAVSVSIQPLALEALFFDDIEQGTDNFTTESEQGWTLQGDTTSSGKAAWFAPNPDVSSDHALVLAPQRIPEDETIILRFQLYFFTDRTFDGLVLEYAIGESRQWFDILAGDGGLIPENPNRFLANGYSDRISAQADSPLAGRWAWTGVNFRFNETLVDLNDFRGQHVRFRWRMVTDPDTDRLGVFLDDIGITKPRRCGCIYPEQWPNQSILGFIPCLNALP